jgi:hypothetical protein
MTYSKARKGELDISELAHLRDTLVDEQHRVGRVLAEINKVLGTGKQLVRTRRKIPRVAPARPSPLDNLKGMREATGDLRESNGNLSAVRVAALYGVSLSKLANWLGRSKQAVNKTPDADSLQDALGYFERVSRLRLMTKDEGEFRKWLRAPHELLDNAPPLELMADGEWQALADYVDDILSGTPG